VVVKMSVVVYRVCLHRAEQKAPRSTACCATVRRGDAYHCRVDQTLQHDGTIFGGLVEKTQTHFQWPLLWGGGGITSANENLQ